jgi:hypothetical protein
MFERNATVESLSSEMNEAEGNGGEGTVPREYACDTCVVSAQSSKVKRDNMQNHRS